jgi:nitrite reductase (NADH) small subunit/3-phenylpropionate/trans-cinnamate dioxygenase ferredoxin subunit
MSEFQTVAKVGDIPEGEGRAYPLGGVMVALFHVDGEYTAIDDTCPHMGASLSTGYVEGDAVTCPWHAWRFSVKDGTWLDNPNAALSSATFAVRLRGDDIQVQVPEQPASSYKPDTPQDD